MKIREMRQYGNRKIFIVLLAIGVSTLIVTVLTVAAIASLLGSIQRSRAIRDRQTSINAVYISLREAESGQRGYLLTGNADYLQPYTASIDMLPGQIDHMARLTRGVPEQRLVDRLATIAREKQTELVRTVELRRGGDQTGALALVNSGEGQRLTEQVQDFKRQIDVVEMALIDQGRRTSTGLGNLALIVAIGAGLLTVALATLVAVLFVKAIAAERALDRAKDEFVSLASHQLRTPATGIKSILSMLAAGDFGPLTDRQQYFMGKAIESNAREINIIEELLNVAKADAGRLVLHTAEFDLRSVIDGIITEQRVALGDKHIQLKVTKPQHPVLVQADEEKLYMAIGNLLDNARKYTPENGTIHISVSGRRGSALVEVADSGIGIDEEDIGRVFDRFQRARSALAGTVEGTGLGLYLVRRIVELHNGTIEVESKQGSGSRFTMTFPLRRA